jgi:diguanylate cyclase (GGDEF)-like protein/PAS domain S-box-containing protein
MQQKVKLTIVLKVVLLATLVSGFNILSFSTAYAAEKITLQLKWHHQFQFAGYYAAQSKGFYQQENLDVNIVEGGVNMPALNQVLTGAAQYGIGDSDILLARMNGKPVVAIASIFQHSPYVLLSLREKKINSPQDLIGKRIMLSNDQGATQFKAMMNKAGIGLEYVTVLPHTWNLQDLIKGNADVVSAYATVEPVQLEAMGYHPSILSNQDYGVDFYGDILFTNEREISAHPERVDAFLRATKKGWAYAFEHREEIAHLIAGMNGVSEHGITYDMLLKEAGIMEPYVLSDVVEFGHMNSERWESIAKTLATLKIIPDDYKLTGFVYSSNASKSWIMRWISVAAITVLILLALAFIWNLQIRRNVKSRTIALQEEIQRREQAENLLKIAGSAAHLGGWIMDIESRKVTWSDEVAAIHDMPSGHSPTIKEGVSLFVPEHQPKIQAAISSCIQSGVPYDLELEKLTIKGKRIWVRTIGQAVRDADGTIVRLQGAFQDISERKRLEDFKAGQNAILERIAANSPLVEVLHATVNLIESQFPRCMCSIMLISSDGLHLCKGAAVKLPSAYMQTLDGAKIGRKNGSCGTAAYQKKRIIVADIESDPLWDNYKTDAMQHGLRACWSSPILSSEHIVIGTFAVYHLEPYIPGDEELELVDACSHILGIAIERHNSQEHLRLLESGISRLNDIVMITESASADDLGHRIIFVNEAFERITGFSHEDVIGKSSSILHGRNTQKEELVKISQALKDGRPVHTEVIHYKKSGEEIWLELDIVPISDDVGLNTHWVAVMRDITQRKQTEMKIQQLAFYDSMTGLPNRQLLIDRLKQRLSLSSSSRSHHSGAVLFIDLDNFKSLNDTHGHDVGDMLLVEVARRIVKCVRDSDTVGRLGGDEFVVIINELDENLRDAAVQTSTVCEKILLSFKESFVLNNYIHHTTPSIGVTLFNHNSPASVDELLKRADLAMYKAKDSGRNTFRFFDPQMEALVRERVALEADLHLGILNQQFVLYFQPQLNQQRRIVGAEALIRWNHPHRGLVMPGYFIQLAEDSGLILQIGDWVLVGACKQLLLWAKNPHTANLVLSVNVSPRQYLQANFVDQVIQLINRTGVDPSKLKLELTESMLVENIEDIITKMTALKAIGVGFSLDDFGTGYSSLSYLKRLPLDQLKIDQSFVRDIMIDSNDASIVNTIIALGLSLGLEVLAEGVETEEQLQLLLSNGCQAFQGYLFSKPVPIDDFELILARDSVENTGLNDTASQA